MIPVCTADQSAALDGAVIKDAKIPSRVLMEVAGLKAAEIIHDRFPSGRIGIACGAGNNGGDGYVIARWLTLWGRDVRMAGLESRTEDAQENRALCERLGIEITDLHHAFQHVDIAVDALLGTGSRRPPEGFIAEAIAHLNRQKHVVSIDIPTGIHPDQGSVADVAVKADVTISLGRCNLGLLLPPGCDYTGTVISVELGLDLAKTIDPRLMTPAAWILERDDIDSWRPSTPASAAKWDRGHVGIIGGGGAATLAAHGAFRGGAGLVTLFAPKSMWKTFHGLWPEVILAEPDSIDPSRHDVIVVGPGLGTSDCETVCDLWSNYPGAVVADADAINVLAVASTNPSTQFPRLLTPHTAEAARLLGVTRAQIESNRMASIAALGDIAPSILKGPHTLIAAGECIWVNPTGSNRLATAGTGDVLAGMVGGYLAAGSKPEQALAIAVWDHGLAGTSMPPQGTATDLLMALQAPHHSHSSVFP